MSLLITWCDLPNAGGRKEGKYHIQAYLSISIVQHRSLEIVYSPEVNFIADLTSELVLKTPKLVYSRSFEMNLQQTFKRSSSHVGWMRATLIYNNNSLSPRIFKNVATSSWEISGHNRSNSLCFQVQLVTCCDHSGFLYRCEVYSLDSS